jgi:outer membrane protein assembly factor BamD (BamD/ComL family)
LNEIVQEATPARRITLIEDFDARYPKSIQLDYVHYLKFLAYKDLADKDKALAVAEEVLKNDQSREDMLYFVADAYLAKRKDLDKVLMYSDQICELVNKREKPDSVTNEQWDKYKQALLLNAYYMTGMVAILQDRWKDADRELRIALTYTMGNEQMSVAVLNNLAWANYKMRNIPEALKLYGQCASVVSPYQRAAVQTIAYIKSEYGLQ